MGDDCFVGKEYNGKELAERVVRFRDEMIEHINNIDYCIRDYDRMLGSDKKRWLIMHILRLSNNFMKYFLNLKGRGN